MAGLEYRGDTIAVGITPAFDMVADTAYYATAKPGDPVVRDASGNIIKAAITDKSLVGVVAARQLLRNGELPKVVKVRTSRSGIYEAAVAAGTPVAGGTYELTSDVKVDATKTTNASVKVLKILPNGNVKVTLL